MSPKDETLYLRPQADRALHTWYGDEYAIMPPLRRSALVQDVASIMLHEELRPTQYHGDGALVAVMLLELDIWPASINDYALSLTGDWS